MGILQKQTAKLVVISYIGVLIGFINKGWLFILFLSSDQIGLLNLIISLSTIFALFSGFGVTNQILRFYPILNQNDKINKGMLPFAFHYSLFGALFLIIALVVFKNAFCDLYAKSPLFIQYYYCFIFIGLSNLIFNIGETYLRSKFVNIIPVVINEILLRILLTILLIIYSLNIISFNTFVILFTIIHIIPSIILLFVLYKKSLLYLRWKHVRLSKKIKRIILKFSLYSFANSIGYQLVLTIDSLMIASINGLNEVGVYTTVLFLSSAIQIPYKAMTRTTYPLVPIYWQKRDYESMDALYKKTSSVSLFISLFSSFSVFIIGNAMFDYLSDDFKDANLLFGIIMIGKIVEMFFGLNGYILVTSKKYKLDIVFTFFLLISSTILNYFFILKYSIFGAAIATSITYILYNIFRSLAIYKFYKFSPFEIRQLYIFLILTISFVLLLEINLFNNKLSNSILQLIIFGLINLIIVFKSNLTYEIRELIIGFIRKWIKKTN